MAQKTLEARLRMIDETAAASRSAAQNAMTVANSYEKLNRAMAQATMRRLRGEARAETTIQRQHISNLEREIALGSRVAAVELERVRATQLYEQQRRALIRTIQAEHTTINQALRAHRELMELEKLHGREMQAIGKGKGAGGGGAILAGLGIAGAFFGLRAGGQVAATIAESRNEVAAFEKSLIDLLTTADNSKGIDNVRRQVLALSDAAGRSREEIADTMFFIQNGTIGVDRAMRDSIQQSVLKMGRATNADLESIAGALIKSYRIFGHEVENVDEMMDKLFATAERGFISHQQLAQFIIQVLSAGEAFGFTLDELLAATSVATKSAGDAGVALTAVRNIVLNLSKAEEHGIRLTGDFANQLKQLTALDPSILKDMFGNRNAAVLFDLVRRTGELRSEATELGRVTGIVDQRLKDLGQNGTQAMAALSRQFAEMQKNLALGLGTNPGLGRFMNDLDAAKAARLTTTTGQLIKDVNIFGMKPLDIFSALDAAGFTDNAAKGYLRLAKELFAANDFEGARNALQRGIGAHGGFGPDDAADVLAGADPKDPVGFQLRALDAELSRKEEELRLQKESNLINQRIIQAIREDQAEAVMMRIREFKNMRSPAEQEAIARAGRDASYEQRVLKEITERVQRAAMMGRTFQEQTDFEKSLASTVGKGLKALFGAEKGEKSIAAQIGKALVGDGPQTLIDKLLGIKKEGGTALPAIGGMLRDGLASILGDKNAAFLGLKKGDGKGLPKDTASEFPPLIPINSGYHGLLEMSRSEKRRAEKAAEETAQNTKAALGHLEALAAAFKNAGVLNVQGA